VGASILTTDAASAPSAWRLHFGRITRSDLVRQNVILFAGGLVAGIGGFVYHAIAARALGPALYGEVASLVAIYAIGTAGAYIIILILARYAAQLRLEGNGGGIRYLITRGTVVLVPPSALAVVVAAAIANPARQFLHLGSLVPLVLLMLALVGIWQLAVLRGVLQGLQRFTQLSLNLSLELVIRMSVLIVMILLGYKVGGAMLAILAGVGIAYVQGGMALIDLLRTPSRRAPLRAMAAYSLTAAAGTLGVMLLYNLDVILAKHYLSPAGAGYYGGLNKIGTILYFLTISVSQVLFPRVVEAVATAQHPGRLLLLSAGIMTLLGAGSLLVFGVVPWLVVRVLFGPAFDVTTPFIFPVGCIGLALSLDNLLIQFFMAVHDRWFVPILGAGCVLEAVLIVVNHAGFGNVVVDVLLALALLLGALSVRALVLIPRLRPEMVAEPTPVSA
jgi:O-antigen/teichoic acid export membrane protein